MAYDESPEAARAFHSALEFAKLTGSELTIITVIERLPAYVSYVSAVAPDVPQILQQEKQTFYAELHHKAREIAEQAGVSVKFATIEGNEIEGLLQLIDDVRPDLLVIGLRREPGDSADLSAAPRTTWRYMRSATFLGSVRSAATQDERYEWQDL